MSEQNPETHQDPATPYETGTQTETEPQPDAELTHGGEGTFTTGDPIEVVPEEPTNAEAVEVAPVDPNVKRDNVHGNDYIVTSESGYRKV